MENYLEKMTSFTIIFFNFIIYTTTQNFDITVENNLQVTKDNLFVMKKITCRVMKREPTYY